METKNEKIKTNLRGFVSIRGMVFAAILVAVSVTGKLLAFNIGQEIRMSYENLPVILAGMVLGPIGGFLAGICSDLCGCFAVGFAINPIIMLGEGSIGLVAGLLFPLFTRLTGKFAIALTGISAHITGSLIIKTIGIAVYYGAKNGFWVLFGTRCLTYLPVITLDIVILYILYASGHVRKELEKFAK